LDGAQLLSLRVVDDTSIDFLYDQRRAIYMASLLTFEPCSGVVLSINLANLCAQQYFVTNSIIAFGRRRCPKDGDVEDGDDDDDDDDDGDDTMTAAPSTFTTTPAMTVTTPAMSVTTRASSGAAASAGRGDAGGDGDPSPCASPAAAAAGAPRRPRRRRRSRGSALDLPRRASLRATARAWTTATRRTRMTRMTHDAFDDVDVLGREVGRR